jgi:hypothetical protein
MPSKSRGYFIDIHPTILSGGIFNIIANKCKLTPVFDTSLVNKGQKPVLKY